MKVLTLTQPWATLVAVGAKRIETRSWETLYRGPLAIHAAKGLGPVGGMKGLAELVDDELFFRAFVHAGIAKRHSDPEDIIQELPFGAIVAVCDLVDCVPTTLWQPVTHGSETWQVPPGNMSQEYPFGDYAPGRFAWLLANVRALPEPVLAKGALGLWNYEGAL